MDEKVREEARRANDADRWLLVRLPARDMIEEGMPPPQNWTWRYKGPADDPYGPSEGEVEFDKLVTWTSSLLDLEALGWVWRGTRRSDMRTGWGLTPEGIKQRTLLIRSGQAKRWSENEKWWRDLADDMAELAATNPAP